ncbi:DUF58 domain-containing protein [Microbacterium sp. W1N]|uniref:DUF58 domain-containing protein n=1 Tax=Microbacterium festucae TaxID=2977531 RepID=UPI0021C23AC6|nr:DUF58 domain-containing protein [Microbacterium festucae]MCT9820974.1 DUF58 domain-containing protein [Microbacterium festucae]
MSKWPLTLRGTGAVILAIACFLLAHEFKIAELLYVCVLLLAVVAASVLTVYLVGRSESVTRSFSPDGVTVGRTVRVRLQVTVRSALPTAQGVWREHLPAGLEGEAAGVFPALSSATGTRFEAVELDYEIDAVRRGIRSVGPLTVTSTDPFGFARRRHTVGAPVAVTVAPAVVDLGAVSDLPGEAGGSVHTSTNQLGQGADNLVPRHYVPGDSMRRIHWRASAHRDQLMVRQEEQETTPEAIVVLDRGVHRWTAEAFRAPGEDPGFEEAVSAAISVVARLVHEGFAVHLIDVDGTEIGESVQAHDTAGVEALAADLATTVARRDLPLEPLVRRFHGSMTGPFVLITGRVDQADAEVLAPLAHHSALPVLLAVAPQHDALDLAARAGWHTAAVHPGGDLAAAWAAAVDRGATRVEA